MTTHDLHPLLASLAARGIALRAEGDKLFATPIAALTADDKQAILACREALLAHLSAPEEEVAPSDEPFQRQAPAGDGDGDLRRGGQAAHVGWLKEGKRGRWRAVARGATWGTAWDALLRVGSVALKVERIVKPEGQRP